MGRGSVVVLVGTAGGLGTSVLAAAVAVRAARSGREVVLVDGCPLGGGLDVVLGVEPLAGIRWGDLSGLEGRADAKAILARLPAERGLPVLSYDRSGAEPPADVTRSVLSALAASEALVVVDAAPTGTVYPSACAMADRLVLVAGDGVRQLAALSVVAARLVGDLADRGEPLGPGSVAVCLRGRSRRGLTMGAVARMVETEIGLTVRFALPDDRSLTADGARGMPPGSRGSGPLTETAEQILEWAAGSNRSAA